MDLSKNAFACDSKKDGRDCWSWFLLHLPRRLPQCPVNNENRFDRTKPELKQTIAKLSKLYNYIAIMPQPWIAEGSRMANLQQDRSFIELRDVVKPLGQRSHSSADPIGPGAFCSSQACGSSCWCQACGRLQYELLKGEGPKIGWVSLSPKPGDSQSGKLASWDTSGRTM